MKAPRVLLAFLAGALATSVAFVILGRRYEVIERSDSLPVIRVDHWTGRTWSYYRGTWVPNEAAR